MLRTDLADFRISPENVPLFLKGKKIFETAPKETNFVPYSDMIHVNLGNASSYGLVISSNEGKIELIMEKNI